MVRTVRMDDKTRDLIQSKNPGTQTVYQRAFYLLQEYSETKLGETLTEKTNSYDRRGRAKKHGGS